MTGDIHWWWVRHGPTTSPGLAGWTDVQADLSDTDRISQLMDLLPEDAVVISSDLSRAVSTADAICGLRRRLPHSTDIREFNFGDWEGLAIEEIRRRYPGPASSFWTDPRSATPPSGESWFELSSRVSGFVDWFSRDSGEQNIIAVAHFGTIMTQITRCAGSSFEEALRTKIDHLSLTRISNLKGEWRLIEAGTSF